MNNVLVVAEHDGTTLNASTARCVTCAGQIPDSQVHVVVLGHRIDQVATQAAVLTGVAKVLALSTPENSQALAATYAPQLGELAAGYTHLLGPSTTFGKDLMPRVAALLGVPQISDLMSVEGAYRFKRPMYAGNAIVTVQASAARKVVATVRGASFAAASVGGQAPVEAMTISVPLPTHTRLLATRKGASDRPDLQTSPKVVAGGRALGSKENFQMIYQLAEKLGAAVGASRAAVDSGYAPNELQVGQTGKIIAPELYLAVGISGAIQHLTGIKDARTIVAINKDPDAPIFEIADVGIVGDLFALLPEIEKRLS